MKTNKLKDSDLHNKLLSAIGEEKKLLAQILRLLKEVERRKLYCDFGCRSLFDYATKILGYSEAEAYTRINAMRLIAEIPEVEEQIVRGELSLTNAAQAQSFFRNRAKAECARLGKSRENLQQAELRSGETMNHEEPGRESPPSHSPARSEMPKQSSSKQQVQQNSGPGLGIEQKREVLKSLCNQSTRSAKAILAAQSPNTDESSKDKTIYLDNGRVELRARISQENHRKLMDLKHRFTKHGEVDPDLDELIERLHAMAFSKTSNGLVATAPPKQTPDSQDSTFAHKKPRINNRTLTPAMKVHIKDRDGHRCVKCGSAKNLEIDHIKPRALGGSHHPDNLQVLCRSCNQRRAIKTFGIEKVAKHTADRY